LISQPQQPSAAAAVLLRAGQPLTATSASVEHNFGFIKLLWVQTKAQGILLIRTSNLTGRVCSLTLSFKGTGVGSPGLDVPAPLFFFWCFSPDGRTATDCTI
jgi:hypothetical protein